MTKKIYIIILNYNGWQDTIECLESVLKSDYSNYQIVVVDNNSPNNSMDYLIKWAEGNLYLWLPDNNSLKKLSFPLEKKPLEYIYYEKDEAISGGNKEKESQLKNPIIFIQAGENRGFAAGNNIGIKYALAKNDFEYIWLLNNDTVIEKDTLRKLVNSMEKEDKNVGLLGCIQYYYDNPNKIQVVGGGFNKLKAKFWNYQSLDDIEKVDYIYGASMFFKKEFFKKIGLLNEEYFLYYEEIDLAERMKGIFKQKVIKDIKLYHKQGQSINTTYLQRYYLGLNKLVFYNNYYYNLIFIPITELIFKTFGYFIFRKKEKLKINLKIIKTVLKRKINVF